jgi:hypothetical protein
MHVPYRAFSFPSGIVPSPASLTFNTDDLAHALFATGRAPGDRTVHGNASVYEWLHRTSLVPAYLRRRYDAALVKSTLALTLDPSEKMALSYALGQAITGVFCEHQLLVAYLMHVDRYANHFGVQFGQTRRRADLFGLAPNGWVVAEAKGHSGSMPSNQREKLERQKRSVKDINGEEPWLALGCVSYFPDPFDEMHVDAFDPDKTEVEAVSFPVTLDRFTLAYYSPFLRALDMGDHAEDDSLVDMASFATASFSQFGLRVGMPNILVDRIRRAETGELTGLYEDVQRLLADIPSTDERVFRDGVTITTAWNEALSLQNWGLYGEGFKFG